MSSKILVNSIIVSLIALYFIIRTIFLNRIKKTEVVIKHWSVAEAALLGMLFMVFIRPVIIVDLESGGIDSLFSVLMVVTVLIAYAVILIVSRIKNKIITVFYSEGTEVHKRILRSTLEEHNIPYKAYQTFVKINYTNSEIRFFNNSLVISKYKSVPNYENFISSLEKNLKSAQFKRNRKQEIIIIGISLLASASCWGALISNKCTGSRLYWIY